MTLISEPFGRAVDGGPARVRAGRLGQTAGQGEHCRKAIPAVPISYAQEENGGAGQRAGWCGAVAAWKGGKGGGVTGRGSFGTDSVNWL